MTGPFELAAKDPKVLLQRIKKSFPNLAWSTYEYVVAGWDHEVLILDNKFVFRFPNSKEYLSLLKNEVTILKDLKPLVSLNIPDYTFIASDHSFAGYPIIPGQPLLLDLFKSLDNVDITAIATQLAKFLTTIYKFQNDRTKKLPSYLQTEQARLKKQAPLFLKSVLSNAEYMKVETILRDVDEILALDLPKTFIHGDVYENHLFWDNRAKQLGLIDFSDMNNGDPAFDFAELYYYGDAFVETLYKAYEVKRDDSFLERAKKYRRWGGVFMMVDHFISQKTSFEVARETFDATQSELI